MELLSILFSGDYWHRDFRTIVSRLNQPTTFVPLDSLGSFTGKSSGFQLIVLARATRNQIDATVIARLQQDMPGVPIVALRGSWCEGEMRTGQPLDGVHHVYWHQWAGQFEKFVQQISSGGICDWDLPPSMPAAEQIDSTTAHPGDHGATGTPRGNGLIGISACTGSEFEPLRAAFDTMGLSTRWLEQAHWDRSAIDLLQAICIETRKIDHDLMKRITWLQSTFPDVPKILFAGFPRSGEVRQLEQAGVSMVLSKPFRLNDLESIVQRFVTTGESMRAPHFNHAPAETAETGTNREA